MATHNTETGQYVGENLTLEEVQVGLAKNFREDLNENSNRIVEAVDATHQRITEERAQVDQNLANMETQIYSDGIQIVVSDEEPVREGKYAMKVGDFWFDITGESEVESTT